MDDQIQAGEVSNIVAVVTMKYKKNKNNYPMDDHPGSNTTIYWSFRGFLEDNWTSLVTFYSYPPNSPPQRVPNLFKAVRLSITTAVFIPPLGEGGVAPKRTAYTAFEEEEDLWNLDIPIDPRLLASSDNDRSTSSTGFPVHAQPLAYPASAGTPSMAFEDQVDTRIRTYLEPLVAPAPAASTTTPEVALEDDVVAGTNTGLSSSPEPSAAAATADSRASDDDQDRANRVVTAEPIMALNRARNCGSSGRPVKSNDQLSRGKQAVDQRSRRKIEEDYRQRILAKVDKDIIDRASQENKTTPTGRTYRAILSVLEQNEALVVALARENDELKKQLEEEKEKEKKGEDKAEE
ncbi:hypothetical protein LTR47_000196 [Exophiala xenobiotica]|nr:hypothetical protein LTR41_003973 [Exophiala xenobiotica]KAK5238453.1 hypothetical protein LTR47_000196 [Exophiala xenobiotica]KAK5245091.1 hypothetical protein LTS06_009424 [Exophiala xenobiotica]KAK5349822.1 hypothetical protein LTR61_006528 [Exophiala xenobiotica]KAK5387260.1 hypothetical protein LTR11_000925 [Exophiala xenobiotica]